METPTEGALEHIETLRTSMGLLRSDVATMEGQLSDLRTSMTAVEEQRGTALGEVAAVEEQRDTAMREVTSLAAGLAAVEAQKEMTEAENIRLRNRLQVQDGHVEFLRNRLQDQGRQLASFERRLQVLEGYLASVVAAEARQSLAEAPVEPSTSTTVEAASTPTPADEARGSGHRGMGELDEAPVEEAQGPVEDAAKVEDEAPVSRQKRRKVWTEDVGVEERR